MTPICSECHRPLHGRTDKKFCSDACRISYHNRKRRHQLGETYQTIRILMHNRAILQSLWSAGKKICRKEELLIKGFCFDYFTGLQRKYGRTTYRCFDWSYRRYLKHVIINPDPR